MNIGAIDATGVDLGKVKNLAGNLGQINAGDGDPARAAQAFLKVRSFGSLGTAAQDATSASMHSDIAGDLRKLKVDGPFGNNASSPLEIGPTLGIGGRLETGYISSLSRATLSVLGQLAPVTAANAVGIGRLTVGDVMNSRILAGYDLNGLPTNADVSIGSVTVSY